MKSSSLIQVFTVTTMNQDQKLTFHQKAQLHTTEQKVAHYFFIYSELLHFGEQTGLQHYQQLTAVITHKIYSQTYMTDPTFACQCHPKTEISFKHSQIMYNTPNYIMALLLILVSYNTQPFKFVSSFHQDHTNFPKILEAPENSGHQVGNKKEIMLTAKKLAVNGAVKFIGNRYQLT